LLIWALFGFMDYMIILKWLTDWSTVTTAGMTSPSIISTMITMFINMGVKGPENKEMDLMDD